MLNTKDTNHLSFIYNRLKNVHGENENYDYMIKLKEIINCVGNNDMVETILQYMLENQYNKTNPVLYNYIASQKTKQ